jgi:glycine/D-amino acid oxidase-like deaminating enzyme
MSDSKDKNSYWLESTKSPGYPALTEDVETDVVIIGAGIAGLTAAYLLKKSGRKVCVVEKDTIGDGISGHTTGKVTSQHSLIYNKLSEWLGEKTARLYGEANQCAIDKIAAIIKTEQIECDWRHEDSYVYTTDKARVAAFQNEAITAAKLGLPATFEQTANLPFPIQGAVRFSNQATFHIRKYLLGLARAIEGGGSHIYEHSHAIGIKSGEPGRVTTSKASVHAKHIIVATNVPTFPLFARGSYCIAEYPMQSYIVAGRISQEIKGMYISPDKHHYSILQVKGDKANFLLIGGEGHIPLTRFNQDTRYKRLAAYAKKYFDITDIEYRWTARDYLGYDDMPLIGKLYPWSKHIYTATGFMKWGLTNGTVAGMLLTDQICDIDNKWTELFNPHRIKTIASIPKVVSEHLGLH